MNSAHIKRERQSGLEPAAPAAPPEVAAEDRVWEDHLVRLLSELEIGRDRLANLQAGKRPGPALHAALTIVDRTVEFTEQRVAGENRDQVLLPILARAGEVYSTTRGVIKELGGSPWGALASLFATPAENKATRRDRIRISVQGIKEVLTSCFELFQTGFQSPEQACQWAQTYQVFLADLTHVLDRVDCQAPVDS